MPFAVVRSAARRSGRASARRMSVRAAASGRGTCTFWSRRPGRSSAGSMRSGRLEAARTDTPTSASTPSSWQSNWLTTRSAADARRVFGTADYSLQARASRKGNGRWRQRTGDTGRACPRRRAMASNSSKKRRHGREAVARANRSRTAASDAPMYLLRSSGPLTDKNGSALSEASAEASSVLPQPGGPYSSTLERRRSGAQAKSRGWRVGSSTASVSARFACSRPPTAARPCSAPPPPARGRNAPCGETTPAGAIRCSRHVDECIGRKSLMQSSNRTASPPPPRAAPGAIAATARAAAASTARVTN